MFVALQEVGSSDNLVSQWKSCLLFNLNRLNNPYSYVLAEKKLLNGVLTFLFCRQAYIKRISRL